VSYIWKKDWLWPYESAWNVLEKFKYINVVPSNTVKQDIGLKNGVEKQSENKYYVFRKTTINYDLFEDFFGFNINHFDELSILKFNPLESYLNSDLFYCPICMQDGYHSYFHQLKSLDKCIFHRNQNLFAVINEKGENISYTIGNDGREAYKSSISTSKKPVSTYFDIPRAMHLIVKSFYTSIPEEIRKIKLPAYKNIRIINPIDNRLPQNISVTNLLRDIFFNKDIKKEPIVELSFEDCKYQYQTIETQAKEYMNNNIINMRIQDYLPGFYTANYVKKLVEKIETKALKYVLFRLNNRNFEIVSPIEKEEYRRVAIKLIFIYHITGSRDIYEAINNTLKFMTPSNYSYFPVTLHSLLNNRIDNNTFSEFLIYFIYDKLLEYMYDRFRTNCEILDLKELHINLKVNIDNLPSYVILEHNNIYSLYEC
jgi:hypothetical protein